MHQKLSEIPSPETFKVDTELMETLENIKSNLDVTVKQKMESLSPKQIELKNLIDANFNLNKEMLNTLSNNRRNNQGW